MARRKTTNIAGSTETPTALATTTPAAVPATNPKEVADVFEWILKGHTESDIREAIGASFPNASADALIVAAVERFAKAGEFEAPVMLGFCVEAYREIYRVSIAAGDTQNALAAVRQLGKLAGFK